VCFNKNKEQLDRAAPSGSGSNREQNEEGFARSRLRRSGDPLKNDDSRHHLCDLTPEEIEQARRIHEMTKHL
jgi:hypothetical protein